MNEKETIKELNEQVKELEAQVSNLENLVVRKRAALRNAQMECNKLRYEHGEIEKLVKALIACEQYHEAKSPSASGYTLSDCVPQFHVAEGTSLYKMYKASNMYVPRSEKGGDAKCANLKKKMT